MSVQSAVEANGWTLVDTTPGRYAGETVVISKRSHSPFGEDRVYVTHKYHEASDSLNHGHYDLTFAQAIESMQERSL